MRKGSRFELARARMRSRATASAARRERRAYLADAAATFEHLGALQMLRRVREAQAQDQTAEANR